MIFLSTLLSVVETTSVALLVRGKVILEVVDEAKEMEVVEKKAKVLISNTVILERSDRIPRDPIPASRKAGLRSRMTCLSRMTGLPPLESPP